MIKGARFATVLLSLLCCVATLGAGPALLRVERLHDSDRTELIRAGIPLVAEQAGCLLALGDARDLGAKLTALGYSWLPLDPDVTGWTYTVVGLRKGARPSVLGACGDALWTEDNWVLLRTSGDLRPGCFPETEVFLRRLDLVPLSLPVPPPEGYGARTEAITPKPLVQTLVSNLNNSTIASAWDDIINSATTRNSTSAGCTTAVNALYNKFSALGLSPYTQNHTSGHAPNVIGVLQGKVNPEKVYIVIGHIDDMPSSGAAPGADDNASGTAAASVAAQVFSTYNFANTVKFIAVTGEEYGLYGSTYYANNAHSTGEQIQAVLNADMIAWEGDTPGSENLDLNFNTTSAWLGTLFSDCATGYGTGCVVDAFLCPGLDASDHAPFWDNGYSAVCGITDNEDYCGHGGSYPYYHTSNDTKANCGNPAFFYGAIKAYVATLAHLADPLCANPFPQAPASLTAVATGANHVSLTWPTAGAGLTYEVYRAPGGCAGGYPASKIGETASTSYDDATASGGVAYGYTIRTKKDQCVSNAGTCDEATTTGSCSEAPSFAGLQTVVNPAEASCKLSLAWAAGQAWCGGPLSYRVYRSTSAPFTPSVANRIADGVAGLSYTDLGPLTYGATYYYIVRAVDGAGGAEDSNTTTVSGVPTGPITIGTWSDDAGDTGTAKLTSSAPWHTAGTGGHTGAKVYLTGTYSSNSCASLTGPEMILGTGSQLTFWSKYDIESGWDKGQVEITADGGASWNRVPVNYPTTATHTGDSCAMAANQTYFTGTNLTWASYTGSLSAWNGMTVQLRWRLSSDTNTEGTGWWVDDIAVTNVQVPSACTSGGGCSVSCTATVPSAASVGYPVSFQATAAPTNCTGTPTFAWSFGDGATSTQQNPSHTYGAAGSFGWSMTATVDGVTCTKTGTIAVTAGCSLACTATVPATVGVGVPASFQATATPTGCTGSPVYAWNFGDGATSAQQNASHAFAGPGNYFWTLTVTQADQTCTKTGTIVVSDTCTFTCGASASPLTGPAPLRVNFSASSSTAGCGSTTVSYAWDFGDGTTSSQKNPVHDYASPGSYAWTMTATSNGLTCSKTGTVIVTPPCTVTCSAAASPGTGQAPLAVTFTASATPSNCTGSPSYAWTFGDGGTSSQQNPSHTYAAAGTYTWTLAVAVGGTTCSKTGTVTATAAPECEVSCTVSATPTSGAAPLEVNFTAASVASHCTGTATYAWTFGDGSTSDAQNPTHTYASVGNYPWTMTVTVDGVTCSKAGNIAVGEPCSLTCEATAEPASGVAPLEVAFTGTATAANCAGTPVFSWAFGDGGTSPLHNPTHRYAQAGTYTWTLTVTVDGETCAKTGVVTAEEPCTVSCAAAASPAQGTLPLAVQFTGSAEASHCSGAMSYSWDFGDGYTSAQQSPSHTYDRAGTFTWFLFVTADQYSCAKTGTIEVVAPCTVACAASADPQAGNAPLSVAFASSVTPSNCAGEPSYAWAFGDGGTSTEPNPVRTYVVPGTYTWTFTVTVGGTTCTQGGTVVVHSGLPGDADGDGVVSIGEVQQVINMFLGLQPAGNGADCDGDGAISIGEVQKVINAFLGLPSSC